MVWWSDWWEEISKRQRKSGGRSALSFVPRIFPIWLPQGDYLSKSNPDKVGKMKIDPICLKTIPHYFFTSKWLASDLGGSSS